MGFLFARFFSVVESPLILSCRKNNFYFWSKNRFHDIFWLSLSKFRFTDREWVYSWLIRNLRSYHLAVLHKIKQCFFSSCCPMLKVEFMLILKWTHGKNIFYDPSSTDPSSFPLKKENIPNPRLSASPYPWSWQKNALILFFSTEGEMNPIPKCSLAVASCGCCCCCFIDC